MTPGLSTNLCGTINNVVNRTRAIEASLYVLLANSVLSSSNEAAPPRRLNSPDSRICRADVMKAPRASRERAEPTEMRRTPISARRLTEKPGVGLATNTLTGLGATARTIADINMRSVMRGAYKQSAPASANATLGRGVWTHTQCAGH